jgi:hypothetical protein
MCVDIERVEPSIKYKHDSEWVEVEFRDKLQAAGEPGTGSAGNSSEYNCVFRRHGSTGGQLGELRTEALAISPSKLKCPLPHPSKLAALVQPRRFDEQQLELSADGLFRVSGNGGKYYYEQMHDRAELGIYVQSVHTPQVRYGLVNADATTTLQTLFNLTILDCNMHRSCVSCLSGGLSGCKWCANECLNPNEEPTLGTCLGVDSLAQCRSFDTGTSKLLIPYTAHRQQAPLMLTLNNFNSDSDLSSSLECMLTLFNGKALGHNVSVPFQRLNRTHGHCSLVSVFSLLPTFSATGEQQTAASQVQTNLRLLDRQRDSFVDSNTNGKLALLFYKCELKASDCSECLAINPQLSCMWCSGSASAGPLQTLAATGAHHGASNCRFMNSQSKLAVLSQCISPAFHPNVNSSSSSNYYPQCDKPQIDLIEPSKLPIGGGSVVIIYGNNLGTKFEDIQDVFIQCATGGSAAGGIKQDWVIERSYNYTTIFLLTS